MDTPETTILLRRARAGEVAGQGALIERLSPLLLAQARYRLGAAAADAEDLVQDVWLRVLPRLPDLEERAGRHTPVLMRFLATTLLHRVQEQLRARIRQRRGGSGERAVEVPDATRGLVTRAMQREREDQLWSLLEDLDEGDRRLLVLRGIEQQSNQAVAEQLGESPNAVSLRFNRLLKRLRERLAGSVLDELS